MFTLLILNNIFISYIFQNLFYKKINKDYSWIKGEIIYKKHVNYLYTLINLFLIHFFQYLIYQKYNLDYIILINYSILISSILLLFRLDMNFKLLPRLIIYPLLLLSIYHNYYMGYNIYYKLLDAIIIYGIIYLPMFIYSLLKSENHISLGDVNYLVLISMWLDLTSSLYILLLTILTFIVIFKLKGIKDFYPFGHIMSFYFLLYLGYKI